MDRASCWKRNHLANLVRPRRCIDCPADGDLVVVLNGINFRYATRARRGLHYYPLYQAIGLGPVGNDQYREYAGHIRKSAEECLKATEITLTAVELFASQQGSKRSVVCVAPLVERTLANFELSNGREAAQWTIALDPSVEAEGDDAILEDVLMQTLYAGRSIVCGADSDATFSCRISSHGHIDGYVELCIAFSPHNGYDLDLDLDATLEREVELNLFFARRGAETMGGSFSFDVASASVWKVIVRLRSVAQYELRLH